MLRYAPGPLCLGRQARWRPQQGRRVIRGRAADPPHHQSNLPNTSSLYAALPAAPEHPSHSPAHAARLLLAPTHRHTHTHTHTQRATARPRGTLPERWLLSRRPSQDLPDSSQHGANKKKARQPRGCSPNKMQNPGIVWPLCFRGKGRGEGQGGRKARREGSKPAKPAHERVQQPVGCMAAGNSPTASSRVCSIAVVNIVEGALCQQQRWRAAAGPDPGPRRLQVAVGRVCTRGGVPWGRTAAG